MHIPCKGHLGASLVAHLLLDATDLDFRRLPSNLLRFGHREEAYARLGPSRSGVDLVNMAVPPRGRACTLGTEALKSVLLRLLYLLRIVKVSIPFRKHGMRGIHLRRSSALPTQRVGTGKGSYTL